MAQATQLVKSDEIIDVSEGRALVLTKEEIKAQADKVVEVMRSIMEKDVHYGKIPGTDKTTLLKPGAEKLLSTFRIACEPVVTDLSSEDLVKYRVEARGTNSMSGAYLGSGIGECSSDEDKYCWRSVICKEEWDQTPEDRRRLKWKKGKEKAYSVQQVRTNPADIANTVLKMAKKRAVVDLALNVTACSDVFSQDIEDLPEEVRDAVMERDSAAPAPVAQPQRTAPPPSTSGDKISEPQAKRFFAIYRGAGISDEAAADYLFRNYNIEDSREILKKDYNAICAWAQKGAA